MALLSADTQTHVTIAHVSKVGWKRDPTTMRDFCSVGTISLILAGRQCFDLQTLEDGREDHQSVTAIARQGDSLGGRDEVNLAGDGIVLASNATKLLIIVKSRGFTFFFWGELHSAATHYSGCVRALKYQYMARVWNNCRKAAGRQIGVAIE